MEFDRSNLDKMTKTQKKNLKKLGTMLRGYTFHDVEFDMSVYDDGIGDGFRKYDCGTVGCAVGHGPYCGIPKELIETWEEYAERSFGIAYTTNDFEYLFCCYHENNQYDVGCRILDYLENGVPRPTGQTSGEHWDFWVDYHPWPKEADVFEV